MAIIDSKNAENRKALDAQMDSATRKVMDVVPFDSEDEAEQPATKRQRVGSPKPDSIVIREPGVEGPYVVAKALRDSLRGQVMSVVSMADKRASLARSTVRAQEGAIEETLKTCGKRFEEYLQRAAPRTPEEQFERSKLRDQLANGAERVLAAMEDITRCSHEPAVANQDAEEELLLTIDDSVEAMKHGIETLEEMKVRMQQMMRQRRRASLPGNVTSFPKLLEVLKPVEAFQKQFVVETASESKRKEVILQERLKTLEDKRVIFMQADLNPARDHEYAQTIRGIKMAQQDVDKNNKDAERRDNMQKKVKEVREQLEEVCPIEKKGFFASIFSRRGA